jgi:hypothetical protein
MGSSGVIDVPYSFKIFSGIRTLLRGGIYIWTQIHRQQSEIISLYLFYRIRKAR